MKVDKEEAKLPGTNFDEVIDVLQVTKLRDTGSHFPTNIFPVGWMCSDYHNCVAAPWEICLYFDLNRL